MLDEFLSKTNRQKFSDDPESIRVVFKCITEELNEFFDAAIDLIETGSKEARADLVKEWSDLQYVVSQAAWFFDIPADEAFRRVHESNMSKVVGDSVIYREDGKILKPDTYKAPDMRGL